MMKKVEKEVENYIVFTLNISMKIYHPLHRLHTRYKHNIHHKRHIYTILDNLLKLEINRAC